MTQVWSSLLLFVVARGVGRSKSQVAKSDQIGKIKQLGMISWAIYTLARKQLVYVKEKVIRGLGDLKSGRVFTQRKVERRMERGLGGINRRRFTRDSKDKEMI